MPLDCYPINLRLARNWLQERVTYWHRSIFREEGETPAVGDARAAGGGVS